MVPIVALLCLTASLVSSVTSTPISPSSQDLGSNLVKRAGISSYTGPKSGQATFYGDDGSGGNCLLPARSDKLFVAWPGASWSVNGSPASQCGACIRVKGPLGSVDVQITNKCPECPAGSLDLSTTAFTKIGAISAGKVPITWDFIDCGATTPKLESGALSVVWKSGSSASWAAIQIRGATRPISNVGIRPSSSTSSFTALARQDYNYFLASSGAGPGPFTVQVTFQDGGVSSIGNVRLNSVIGDA